MSGKQDFFTYYKGVRKSFQTYWQLYGGWLALYRSPYLHLAILLSIASFPLWTSSKGQVTWYGIAISVLPNLLGFTLGGFAILLAFGNEKFLSRICGPDNDGTPSPYLKLCGSFAHFIVVQVLALMLGFLGNAWPTENWFANFLGLAVFYYAILTTLMATLAILNMCNWFDSFAVICREEEQEKKKNLPDGTGNQTPTQ
jgi:hypothetical protein